MAKRKGFLELAGELIYLWSERARIQEEKAKEKLEQEIQAEEIDFPSSRRVSQRRRRRRPRVLKEDEEAKISKNKLAKAIKTREKELFALLENPGKDPLAQAFSQLCNKYQLTRNEQKILLVVLGDELKDFLKSSFWELIGFAGISVGEILNVVFGEVSQALRHINLFAPNSRLIKNQLLKVWERRQGLLNAEVRLGEQAQKALLFFEESESEEDELDIFSPPKNQILEIINSKVRLEDVVLGEEKKQAIIESLTFYQDKEAQKLARKILGDSSMGFLALFYGPPGTGKTYTAQAIAGELGKELGLARYERLISVWYGGSEKNLVECFRSARQKDLVLVFDEADALVSSRALLRASGHGTEARLRNIFLQEIERFNGICILTTNFAQALDPALERRLNLKLEFGIPEFEERVKVWQKYLKGLPLADDVNLEELARAYPLSPAHIKNAILGALKSLSIQKKSNKEAKISSKILQQSLQKELAFQKTEKRAGFLRG